MSDIFEKCRAGGEWICGRWINFSDDDRRAAADEIERLRATLNAKPTPEAILLQARKPEGGPWIDIFPAQLGWMAKAGFDVRALDGESVESGTEAKND